MKEFKILEFAEIDFPFMIERGKHTISFPPHTHNFIELEIIVNGRADHIVEGRAYHIKKGDVVIIRPSYVHELQKVDHLEFYNYKFDLDKLILIDNGIEKMPGFQSLFVMQPFENCHYDINYLSLGEEKLMTLQILSELMLEEWQNKRSGYKLSIKNYLMSLITFLIRNDLPRLTSTSSKTSDIIHSVNFIHEKFHERITLTMLSRMTSLSERQYSRIFHEVYGISPIDYVINCRLTLACRLLKTTNKSLSDISKECGFGDKVSFSRLFKRRYDITPGEYRNL